MSLITYNKLCDLISSGLLYCDSNNPEPFNRVHKSQINGASIDVRLGTTILRETRSVTNKFVNLKNKDELNFTMEKIPWGEKLYLSPGEFVLAQTVEIFNLPNNIGAEFRLKSSSARSALDQALAVWCDPGWHGSVLTLELKNNANYHSLVLEAGMKIGQIVFFVGEPVPDFASYAVRGQYNNDKEVTANKGVK